MSCVTAELTSNTVEPTFVAATVEIEISCDAEATASQVLFNVLSPDGGFILSPDGGLVVVA
jgi:hypothetical protein